MEDFLSILEASTPQAVRKVASTADNTVDLSYTTTPSGETVPAKHLAEETPNKDDLI